MNRATWLAPPRLLVNLAPAQEVWPVAVTERTSRSFRFDLDEQRARIDSPFERTPSEDCSLPTFEHNNREPFAHKKSVNSGIAERMFSFEDVGPGH
ncbi:hypothetical protein [Streptomyces sp. NPDC005322]|uniref:hypothetical protein n=1 Tax=unclassified Streptomyces TaxID=2593676 RepID=UPI0033B4CE03